MFGLINNARTPRNHHSLGASQMEWLWAKAQQSGIERSRFVQLLSLGGAAAVLSACSANSTDANMTGNVHHGASFCPQFVYHDVQVRK